MNPGAGNETRTRDPDLGKVVLYQLSYSRIGAANDNRIGAEVNSRIRSMEMPFQSTRINFRANSRMQKALMCPGPFVHSGAGNETRTRDPDLGKVVLYQLSYSRIGAGDSNT